MSLKAKFDERDKFGFLSSSQMKIETNRILLLIPVVILGIAVCACSLSKDKELVERSVEQFHKQFNDGLYHEIYIQSDEGFRRTSSEANVIALFEAVRMKLGMVKTSSQIGWSVNVTSAGKAISLKYNTEFTGGYATEQFIFLVSAEQAKLYTYNINSPLLITK